MHGTLPEYEDGRYDPDGDLGDEDESSQEEAGHEHDEAVQKAFFGIIPAAVTQDDVSISPNFENVWLRALFYGLFSQTW